MERVICRGRKRCIQEGVVRVSMKCSIVAKGKARVFAKDNAKVTALDSAVVNAYDNSEITAYHNSKINVYGDVKIIKKDPGVKIFVGFGSPTIVLDLDHERSTVDGERKAKRRVAPVAKPCAKKRSGSGSGGSSPKSGNCKAKSRCGVKTKGNRSPKSGNHKAKGRRAA